MYEERLQELERLATVAATEPLVVLHNPCGAYAGDHVRKAVQAALKRAPSLERLASHADPVRALCGATCAHPSLDRTKYRSLVAAAAGRLERISKARRSLGILALSPFTHFPEVEGALATLGLGANRLGDTGIIALAEWPARARRAMCRVTCLLN